MSRLIPVMMKASRLDNKILEILEILNEKQRAVMNLVHMIDIPG